VFRLVAVVLLIAAGCARGDRVGRDAGSPPAAGTNADAATDAAGEDRVDAGMDAGPASMDPPDASAGGAGSRDAGTTDAGSPDAGARDAGAATIDCAPYDAAKLAWQIRGYQSPWRTDDSSSYHPVGDDGLDGIIVGHSVDQGHFSGETQGTYGPDGGVRLNSIAGYSCHPVSGCQGTTAIARRGRVVSSVGFAWSSAGDRLIYQIDPVPPGSSQSSYWNQTFLGTNGPIAAFAWDDWHPPASTAVTAVGGDGRTIWQRAFPHATEAVAVDDSGVTLLRFSYAADLVAIDLDGRTLYSQTPDGTFRDLQAAGGRYYLGGRDVFRVADGTSVVTLPFDGADKSVLTASRLVVLHANGPQRWALSSFDFATGTLLWERPAVDDKWGSFSVSGDRTVLIDPDHVLHVLHPDGSDLVACKVAPDVRQPLLLPGGRLALSRYPNLEVYDLP